MPATRSRTSKSTISRDPSLHIHNLLASYQRHLEAERRRAATIRSYTRIAFRFHAYAFEHGFPPLYEMRREHIEHWLADISRSGLSSSTQHGYYLFLRAWFKWLTEEGEIRDNPMERIKPPAVDEPLKDVLTPEQVAAGLEKLDKDRRWRDAAFVALFYDTGMRVGEVAGLRIADIDLANGLIRLAGSDTKNRFGRTVPISPKVVRYIDRYLRRREDGEPWFAMGQKGQLTTSGIYGIVRAAFAFTGLIVGPHDLRHTSATHISESDLTETQMMTLYGWKTPAMARHYTRSAHVANAIAAHRRASPLERLGK